MEGEPAPRETWLLFGKVGKAAGLIPVKPLPGNRDRDTGWGGVGRAGGRGLVGTGSRSGALLLMSGGWDNPLVCGITFWDLG